MAVSRSKRLRKIEGNMGCGFNFHKSEMVTLSFDKSSFSVSTSYSCFDLSPFYADPEII